jgi:hypothetical protein
MGKGEGHKAIISAKSMGQESGPHRLFNRPTLQEKRAWKRAIMGENRRHPEPDDLTDRLRLSRQSIELSDRLLQETRVIPPASVDAIQRSRKRIQERDQLLSRYMVLPDLWSR